MNRISFTNRCIGAAFVFAMAVLCDRAMIQTVWSQEVATVSVDPDAALRKGDIDAAVIAFDRLADMAPERMPYLWQRGIALYFAGRFDDAAEQFRQHRVVNPNDVENAAWHFLCVAKSKSPDVAKTMLLPAPGDRREPMDEVLSLLTTGDTALVQRRMDNVAKSSPGSQGAEDAAFYGAFYLGLYADAKGDLVEAQRQMNAAAKVAPPHYMGDIAKVYAARLRQAQPASAAAD